MFKWLSASDGHDTYSLLTSHLAWLTRPHKAASA